MAVTPIPPAYLIDRRIYRVRSRNLVIGAWSAADKGFIGIREKFGARYLFTEYEYDLAGPPFGTARAMDDLGADVPADVLLKETLGLLDDSGREAAWDRDAKEYYWVDDDEVVPDGVNLAWRTNQALFDLLVEHEPRALALYDAEVGE